MNGIQALRAGAAEAESTLLFPHTLKFENYRSLRDAVVIPFSRKITFLVGPNNAGKSNILRFLAILFNQSYGHINFLEDTSGNEKIKFTVGIKRETLADLLQRSETAGSSVRNSELSHIDISYELTERHVTPIGGPTFDKTFWSLMSSRAFLSEFGRSGSLEHNRDVLLSTIKLGEIFKGTTYLPNVRFLTKIGEEPPFFLHWKYPGITVAFGEIIKRLASMDRPDIDERHLRDHKTQIEAFMARCLERRSVRIEVPDNKRTVIVNIDGDERSIDAFGTGVEQLLMIGLASTGFRDKLVLIDEPEIHLHPRAQKRMIDYMNREIEAQFVIATHSAAILDAAPADIVAVSYSEGKSTTRTISNSRDRYNAVRDLGYSAGDIVQAKFVIWVEGPSDRIYLNFWIASVWPAAREGIDYAILFYGGRILSHHGFADETDGLVAAASLSRAFAVVIDSDKKRADSPLNATKTRVVGELVELNGFCWITDGREVENYIPKSVLVRMKSEYPTMNIPRTKYDQIIQSSDIRKTDFANTCVAQTEWVIDGPLKANVARLVSAMKAAGD